MRNWVKKKDVMTDRKVQRVPEDPDIRKHVRKNKKMLIEGMCFRGVWERDHLFIYLFVLKVSQWNDFGKDCTINNQRESIHGTCHTK